jgi:hypothetical protein
MRPQLFPKRGEAGSDAYEPQANAIAGLKTSRLVLEPAARAEFVLGLALGQGST